jgi:hypothetical protein
MLGKKRLQYKHRNGAPMQMIRITLVYTLFRQFVSCYGLFDCWINAKYIVVKNKIDLHFLKSSPEKLDKGSLLYFIFSDNICMLYICLIIDVMETKLILNMIAVLINYCSIIVNQDGIKVI